MLGANNTISVKRLETDVSGHRNYGSTAVYSDVTCYIESADPKVVAIFDAENMYRSYNCITDTPIDVKIGDLITDGDGNTYIANGVQVFDNNKDVDNHTEITMYKNYPDA